MTISNLKRNRYFKIVLPIFLIVIIISAFYIGKWQGLYSSKIYPTLSSTSKVVTSPAPSEEIGYGPATTTITLPADGYSTKISPVQPIRSLAQLSKHADSFDGAYPYYEYYVKDVDQFGDIARRYIDKSLGISEVRKFDTDMDGRDETIITLCDYVANGCPHKFIIVKDNRIIFSINQGYRHLNLVKSVDGNGFTVHWTPTVGTKEEMERSYCCPIAHMETTFIYKNGTFKPLTEKKVRTIEIENIKNN